MRVVRALFYGFLLICSHLFFSCTRPPVESFSSFMGIDFNDRLHSLDTADAHTLIIGTEDGKLIFYNTVYATNHQVEVGNDKVYFAHLDTLSEEGAVAFVGVRNEGLKMYSISQGYHYVRTFKYGIKDTNYSVYKVIRYNDELYCSTSNGLAKLHLNPTADSLVPCYPDTVPPDFKVAAMVRWNQNIVFAHGDSLFYFDLERGGMNPKKKESRVRKVKNLNVMGNELMVIGEDSIDFKGKKYSNDHMAHSCCEVPGGMMGENDGYCYSYKYLLFAENGFLMGPSLDSLTPYRFTLDKEKSYPTANIIYKKDFVYAIFGSTLCKIPRHPTKEKCAITTLACQDKSSLLAVNNENAVYIQRDNGEWERRFVINKTKKLKASQAISDNGHLCLCADNDVYFDVEKDGGTSMKRMDVGFPKEKINRIYYNDDTTHRVFFAWRSGYGYGTLRKDGMMDTSKREHFRNSDGIISVQCFAQPRDKKHCDSLYIGTLNNGCILMLLNDNSTNVILDTFFRHLTNIIDMVVTDTNIFILTPVYLYRAPLGSHSFSDSTEIRHLHIGRIHCLEDDIVGVSKMGGLYLFQQGNLRHDPTSYYTDILFYPDAIHIDTLNTITAGTNIGIVTLNLNTGKLSSQKINDGVWLRLLEMARDNSDSFVTWLVFIIPILALLLFFLTILVSRKTVEIRALSNVFSDFRNSELTLLKNKYDYLLNLEWEIGGESLTEKMAQHQSFHDYQAAINDVFGKIQRLSPAEPDFKKQFQKCEQELETSLFAPRMRLDTLALREWCVMHSEQLMDDESYRMIFREQIDNIINRYIREFVKFDGTREKDTCELFLKIWATALIWRKPEGFQIQQDESDVKMDALLKPSGSYRLLTKPDRYKKVDVQNYSQTKSQLKNDLKGGSIKCQSEDLKGTLNAFLSYHFPYKTSK